MDPTIAHEAKAEAADSGDHAALNLLFQEFVGAEQDVLLAPGAEPLDDATLASAYEMARPSASLPGGHSLVAGAPPQLQFQLSNKRSLEESLSDTDDDDDGKDKGAKRGKTESVSAAATKKACREKARREKLNERFTELAKLVDPGGEPKTDKNTILTDAIKYVQQVQVENHQLRQLNKFLEERVGTLERDRGQQLYQHSLMMQQAQMMPQAAGMMSGGMVGGPAAVMPGMGMAHPHAQMAAMGGPAANSILSSSGGPAGLHAGTSSPPLPAGMAGMAAAGGAGQSGSQQGQAVGMGMGMMGAMGVGLAGGMNMGAGTSKQVGMMGGMAGPPFQGMFWVPPTMLDSTQDSLLRPPAA